MMITYSDRTHLLEQHDYHYEIQDVSKPNLYRELFPYDEIPKVSFNDRKVPMNMPEKIFITDTTFRDGQQAREPYTVEQIVHLFKLLHKLGGPNGIIRQTEFFVYSQKDREALLKCRELGFEFPEITTWIRANLDDCKLVRDLGIKETGILVSCSDYHIFHKLGMTRREAVGHYLEVVSEIMSVGLIPRCHFEDITRADFYGFVVPFASELMKLSKKTGIPVRIRACDTMGYGVPYPGASLPRSVAGIVYGLTHYADIPPQMLEWHGHNDFHKAVVNASAAWLYGASCVNCSLLGIGERTGNVPLEAMVMEYASLRGTNDGMDLSAITEIAAYYEKEIGYSIPPMMPFVGSKFNVTSAGIHADGLLKNEEIYTIFNTDKLLNRPSSVAVSNVSGLAGIAFWINQHFHLSAENRVVKSDPIVGKIKEWVDCQYKEGRVTAISDEELENEFTKLDA